MFLVPAPRYLRVRVIRTPLVFFLVILFPRRCCLSQPVASEKKHSGRECHIDLDSGKECCVRTAAVARTHLWLWVRLHQHLCVVYACSGFWVLGIRTKFARPCVPSRPGCCYTFVLIWFGITPVSVELRCRLCQRFYAFRLLCPNGKPWHHKRRNALQGRKDSGGKLSSHFSSSFGCSISFSSFRVLRFRPSGEISTSVGGGSTEQIRES